MATGSLHVNRDIILASKRQHLRERQGHLPVEAVLAVAQMQNRPRYLLDAFDHPSRVAIIGQVTRTPTYDPVAVALRWRLAGADAVAFFTDHAIYSDDLDDLLLVARGVRQMPVIYQNYVLDEYHVISARAADASALVLHGTLLPRDMLRRAVSATQRWKMTAIVQVATPGDLEYANLLSPHIIFYGDNLSDPLQPTARELKTLRRRIPNHTRFMLSHALQTPEDARLAMAADVGGVLLHEDLLYQPRLLDDVRRILVRS